MFWFINYLTVIYICCTEYSVCKDTKKTRYGVRVSSFFCNFAATMEQVINQTVEVLRRGGVVLYPTDTIWGIGCDARNAQAVEKLYRIKERDRGILEKCRQLEESEAARKERAAARKAKL